jgi:hypothetical protein
MDRQIVDLFAQDETTLAVFIFFMWVLTATGIIESKE